MSRKRRMNDDGDVGDEVGSDGSDHNEGEDD